MNQAKSHVLKDSAAEKGEARRGPQQLATLMRWHHGKKLVLIEDEARTSFPIFSHREKICSVNAKSRIVHHFETSMKNKWSYTLLPTTLWELAIIEKGIFIIIWRAISSLFVRIPGFEQKLCVWHIHGMTTAKIFVCFFILRHFAVKYLFFYIYYHPWGACKGTYSGEDQSHFSQAQNYID